jgi:predicted MFS family arabinose efflux permease
VTVFAAVYSLAVPPLIRATRRVRRERLLVGALTVFALANAATAAAPTLVALVAARIVAACAGVFMATAAAVAAGTAAREHRGRGLAVVVAAPLPRRRSASLSAPSSGALSAGGRSSTASVS